jgi:hypothetical protein
LTIENRQVDTDIVYNYPSELHKMIMEKFTPVLQQEGRGWFAPPCEEIPLIFSLSFWRPCHKFNCHKQGYNVRYKYSIYRTLYPLVKKTLQGHLCRRMSTELTKTVYDNPHGERILYLLSAVLFNIQGNSASLRAKPVHISGHLPLILWIINNL